MATTSGSLVDDVKSPYSSPYVHYSCSYSSTRASGATKAVSVTLNFKAWLNSNSSYLGTGIILNIYARLNGGAWQSVTIKSSSATWGANNTGTTKHSAPALTLTGASASDRITVEFYVARSDSGGNSGKLGSPSNPKSYSAKLPAYSAATYSVTYSVSGDIPPGYTAPTDSASYTSGATVTVKTVPTAGGYTFNGWLKNGARVTSFAISGNTTLTGVWTRAQAEGRVYVKVSGVWKEAAPYVRVNGAWKKAIPYIKVSGAWKKGVS